MPDKDPKYLPPADDQGPKVLGCLTDAHAYATLRTLLFGKAQRVEIHDERLGTWQVTST